MSAAAAPPLALGRAGLHVWWCPPDALAAPERRAACEALLTPEEQKVRERFRFARHREEYLATRALVRCALSLYAEVPPADWRFAAGEHGKPRVAGPAGVAAPHFNLSNTSGLVACAVSAGEEVGLDVEKVSRRVELLEIAERFFSPEEEDALRRLPAERQRERFFEYWTLKESYIKARGLGLSVALERFSFQLEKPGEIGLRFEPGFDDHDADAWQFALLRPEPGFRLAVAVRRPQGRGAEPRGGAFVPLETGRRGAAACLALPLATLRRSPAPGA